MKKLIFIIGVVAVLFSCNSKTEEIQKNNVKDDAHEEIANPKYSDQQVKLLNEFSKICTVFNRYRFYIHSLNESRNKDDFQTYIDKNWTNEQKMLTSNLDNIIQLSPFLIEYKDMKSIDEQIKNISEIEKYILEKYEKLDQSINWNKIMINSIPTHLRKK